MWSGGLLVTGSVLLVVVVRVAPILGFEQLGAQDEPCLPSQSFDVSVLGLNRESSGCVFATAGCRRENAGVRVGPANDGVTGTIGPDVISS
jgi:hypothetical protein